MKKIIFILIMFSLKIASSQGYSGMVVDSETNKSIPYASIWIIDLNTGVACNDMGKFNINLSLPNTINLKITAIGYSPSTISIKKSELEKNSTFYLSHSHIELQEVEISESTGVLQNYSITNVESKSIDELNIISTTSLGQAIANMAGVYTNSTGNGINKPVIRGLSGTRVSTYVNGLKIENQQWGSDHGLGVDAVGIGKVEVIKGPASLLYGSDALGGVLYLKEEEYAKTNTLEAGVNSQFETNTLGINSGFKFKIAKKNIRFNLFGNHTSQADYKIPNGKYIHNSRYNGKVIKSSFGYNKKNWILNIRYTYLNNELGIPGHSHDSIPNYDDLFKNTQKRKSTLPVQINENHYLSTENKFFFKNSELKFTLGAIRNNLLEFEDKHTIPAIHLSLNTYSYNGLWNYRKSKKHSLLIGTQGNFQTNKNDKEAEEILLRNLSTTNHGLFSMIHSKWNKKWQTQIGIRADINQYLIKETDNFAKQEFNYNSLNYSIGTSYTNKKHAWRVNISSGYRPPHPVESLANGIHHASRRYEIGSLNLKPEYANQIDISYEFCNDHIGLLINPYVTKINNYIFLAPEDSSINNFQVYRYKQNKSTWLYGGEISFHYHPHFLHDLHLESNASFLYAENQNKEPISFIPQPKIKTLITYKIDNKNNFIPDALAFNHSYFLSQNRVIINEIASQPFHLFDFGLNWNIKSKKMNGIFKIGMKNITNNTYINHLSELKQFSIPNQGRNIYISLNFNINTSLKKNEKNN